MQYNFLEIPEGQDVCAGLVLSIFEPRRAESSVFLIASGKSAKGRAIAAADRRWRSSFRPTGAGQCEDR